jgi:hypothetical protein
MEVDDELVRVLAALHAGHIDPEHAAPRVRKIAEARAAAAHPPDLERAAAAFVLARSYRIPQSAGLHEAVNSAALKLAAGAHKKALQHGELDGLMGDILVRRVLEHRAEGLGVASTDSPAMDDVKELLVRVHARTIDLAAAAPELGALVTRLDVESRDRRQLAEAAYVLDRAHQYDEDTKYFATLAELSRQIEEGKHVEALARGDLAEALAHIDAWAGPGPEDR